jgi:hypothetical protein
MKFGRTFSMRIQIDDELNAVEFDYPLTVEFNIVRNTFASANTGSFTIYNLGIDRRRQIYHDRYDTLNYRQIIMQAGYTSDQNTPLATIFQGNVQSGYSFKRKQDWTTKLECFDGGFGILNGQASVSVGAGWTPTSVVKQLVGSMPNVTLGTVSLPGVQNSRALSLFGNAWDIIRRLTGNNTTFIDNEKVNAVTQGTYITPPDGIPLITSDTGLLGTPRKMGGLLEVDMIFEPRIVINQLVALESEETYYNGQYAVMGFTHRGTISGAVCGDAITTLSLWSGTQALEPAQ